MCLKLRITAKKEMEFSSIVITEFQIVIVHILVHSSKLLIYGLITDLI